MAAAVFTLLLLFSFASADLSFRGVVFSGAEANTGTLPGIEGTDYVFPSNASVQFFLSSGMNLIRLPLAWERVQPTLYSPLDPTYLSYLDSTVAYITQKGATAWINLQNGLRYNGQVVGEAPQVPYAALNDVWTKLARRYLNNPRVAFGIMNEPYITTTENVFNATQQAINAIRSTGATQKVIVNGNGWSGVASWLQNWYGTPNSQVMGNLVDSANNIVFDMHQFLDSDYSGSHPDCADGLSIPSLADGATNWLRVNGYKGFVGATGVADTTTCYTDGNALMGYLYTNSDVWLGFTYWGAGWAQQMYNVNPTINADGTGSSTAVWTNFLSRFTGPTAPADVIPKPPVFNPNVTTGSLLKYRGVSESGPEWYPSNLPGVIPQDYAFPTSTSLQFFLNSSLNLIRLPFLWERAQPTLFGALNTQYLSQFDASVSATTNAGKYALLDLHNYFGYGPNKVNTTAVPQDALADLWTKLAQRYAHNPLVQFGLMNEPNTVTTEAVLSAYQLTINAIRRTGATQTIVVDGNGWSGAHSWLQNWYGTPNTLLGQLTDPANNLLYDMHQYLDSDFSGTHASCIANIDWVALLNGTTQWLRSNGKKAIIGEWGVPYNQGCYDDAAGFLTYLNANSDVWVGQIYWAAGPMWGSYFMGVEPIVLKNGTLVPTNQWTDFVSKFAPYTGSACITVVNTLVSSWTEGNNGRKVYQYSATIRNSADVQVDPLHLDSSSNDASRIVGNSYWNIVKGASTYGRTDWTTPEWQHGLNAHATFSFGYTAYDGPITFHSSDSNICKAPPAPPAPAPVCGGSLYVKQTLTSSWYIGSRYVAQYSVNVYNTGSTTRNPTFVVSAADNALLNNYWNIVDSGTAADKSHTFLLPHYQNGVAAGKSYNWGYIAYDRQVQFVLDGSRIRC